MAASSKLIGKFIGFRFNEWSEPIPGDNGRAATPPGASLSFWVWTPHDSDVCLVKLSTVGKHADPEAVGDMLDQCQRMRFGDAVVVLCGPLSYGAYRGQSFEAVPEHAKPKAAAGAAGAAA